LSIAGFRGIIAGDMGKTPEKPALTLVGSAATMPAPSRPLGEHGMGLWRAVMLEYGIADIGGRELLCLACQALDRAESLSAAIAEDGQTIRTRTGVRAHRRCVTSSRIGRSALAFLKSSGLPSRQLSRPVTRRAFLAGRRVNAGHQARAVAAAGCAAN